jgi:hypothetical protein
MHFSDQSTGFEIDLPEGWRKLMRFEYVRNNVFQDVLPASLTDGPVLAGSGGQAMVVTVRQVESAEPDSLKSLSEGLAGASGLVMMSFSITPGIKGCGAAVIWKSSGGDKTIKSYFFIHGRLLWIVSVLLNGDEVAYDKIVGSFRIHPLVEKMMG